MQLSNWLKSACIAAVASVGLVSGAYAQSFAKGADVSWVTHQESFGYVFRANTGVQTELFSLLKAKGVDSVRLRVWVNPANGWNNGVDVLAKARRAAAQGQRIMIDFHYSDSWADVAKQKKPAAWAHHTIDQLVHDVRSHTTGILNYLKNNGVTVTWVQVGNEVNGGMLWPEGASSNFGNLARLINSGYYATKAVYPNAKVIVHLAGGARNADFRRFFDSLSASGGKWDITGMSHFPLVSDWQNQNNLLSANMWDMAGRYAKPVVISEVAMDFDHPTATYSMLSDVINKTRALGANGAGVFYWEPQAYPYWEQYHKGAMDAGGKFTRVMDAFAY